MFQPDSPDSIWVPLCKVHWWWSGEAVQELGEGWILEESDCSQNPTGEDTTTYPDWTYNISMNHWDP
jgi:hypothetical protein